MRSGRVQARMSWSWPSWVAIALGVLSTIAGAVLAAVLPSNAMLAAQLMPLAFLLGGLILLAAGLHGLQTAWSSCGDCCAGCGWGDGCGCDHCSECANGSCCGHCGCEGEDEGHEGHEHGNGAGHSH